MIQWFPGHMAKTVRQLKDKSKSIDGLVDIRDARIPLSSKTPILDQVFENKPKLIILNKADLADPLITKQWIKHLESPIQRVIPFSSQVKLDKQLFLNEAKKLRAKVHKKFSKAAFTPPLYLAVFGIPNVGKSTFINTMMGKRHAKIGDRPGVTKSVVWNKVNDFMHFLDTPGLTWQKFETQNTALKLALVFALKKERFDLKTISDAGLDYMLTHYIQALSKRYPEVAKNSNIETLSNDKNSYHIFFEQLAKQRQYLASGNELDVERAHETFLRDLRTGLLGRLTLEHPPVD